jgi:hypothetical protein
MNRLLDFDIIHEDSKLEYRIKNDKDYDGVLLFSLEESLDWKNLIEKVLPRKIKILKDIPYKIVLGDTCPYETFQGEKILKANPFLLKTVYNIKQGHPHNTKWNYNSDKALILTGKPHRINRIGFLIECIKRGILKNHVYSLFKPKESYIIEETKKILKTQYDRDYDMFFKKYENNPDGIGIRNTQQDMHYSGFPFSKELFEQTLISVVLETNLYNFNNNNPDFSEKTYKTIINKHPFIMWNMPNSLWFLKQYGFYTFEEYFKHVEYESIFDGYDKNIAIADNLEYFLENYHSFIDEINEKIEHNYNLMLKIHDDFKQNYPSIYSALSREFFIR